MRFRVQVVCVADDGAEETRAVTEFTRSELVMESLGMTLAEGMAALKGIQEFVTERQATEFLREARACERCGRARSMKSGGTTRVRTVYGSVRLPNPRWRRCRCAPPDGPKTF